MATVLLQANIVAFDVLCREVVDRRGRVWITLISSCHYAMMNNMKVENKKQMMRKKLSKILFSCLVESDHNNGKQTSESFKINTWNLRVESKLACLCRMDLWRENSKKRMENNFITFPSPLSAQLFQYEFFITLLLHVDFYRAKAVDNSIKAIRPWSKRGLCVSNTQISWVTTTHALIFSHRDKVNLSISNVAWCRHLTVKSSESVSNAVLVEALNCSLTRKGSKASEEVSKVDWSVAILFSYFFARSCLESICLRRSSFSRARTSSLVILTSSLPYDLISLARARTTKKKIVNGEDLVKIINQSHKLLNAELRVCLRKINWVFM